jgi:hypothetical protein
MNDKANAIIALIKRGGECIWEPDLDEGGCVLGDEVIVFERNTYLELLNSDSLHIEYPSSYQVQLVYGDEMEQRQ